MDKPIGILIVVMLVLTGFYILMLFAAQDSCESQGGNLTLSHYQPMYNPGSKSMYMSPVYNCIVKSDNNGQH